MWVVERHLEMAEPTKNMVRFCYLRFKRPWGCCAKSDSPTYLIWSACLTRLYSHSRWLVLNLITASRHSYVQYNRNHNYWTFWRLHSKTLNFIDHLDCLNSAIWAFIWMSTLQMGKIDDDWWKVWWCKRIEGVERLTTTTFWAWQRPIKNFLLKNVKRKCKILHFGWQKLFN